MSPPERSPTPSALYADRFPDGDEAFARWRRGLWRVLVEDFFSRWIPADATVLDFGCGTGEFLNAVAARRRIGVDLRPEVRDRLASGIEFQLARGAALPDVETGTVDVVFCSNLLEHLPDRDTVSALLREFARVMSPRGRLLVLGPNLRYTGAAYWDFFDHVLPFTHHSVREALTAAGLEVETLLPRFLPYSSVGERLRHLFLVRLYLRAPWAWRVLGAQFFAVARPRGSA